MKCKLDLYLRGKIDAVLIVMRLQEEYHAKGKKLYMCFVDLEKAFDRVARKVLEWTTKKKGIPEVLVRSVMSLYEGAKTSICVDSELSEEFEVEVGMHQLPVLTLFLFAIVVDVVTELARDGVLSELLYADILILMRERDEGLRNKCVSWKAFESKSLKVNLGKASVMVGCSITNDGWLQYYK